MNEGYSSRRGRRVMLCVRGNCAPPEDAYDIEKHLLALIEEYGLDDSEHPQHVRCMVTQCLAVCNSGPIMMVHPEGIRYKQVTKENLEIIFQEHFLKDQPVQPLIYDDMSARRAERNKRGHSRRERPKDQNRRSF